MNDWTTHHFSNCSKKENKITAYQSVIKQKINANMMVITERTSVEKDLDTGTITIDCYSELTQYDIRTGLESILSSEIKEAKDAIVAQLKQTIEKYETS